VNLENNDLGKSISKSTVFLPIIPPNVDDIEVLYNSTGNNLDLKLNVQLSFSSANEIVFLLLDGTSGDLSTFKLLSKSQIMNMSIEKNQMMVCVVNSPLNAGDSVKIILLHVSHSKSSTDVLSSSSSAKNNNTLIFIAIGTIFLVAIIVCFIFRKQIFG
jgi:hypothetical protein